MILATRHTGIVVRNIARQQAFYEGLGLRLFSKMKESGDFIEQVVGVNGAVINWVKLKADDGSLVELLHYESHPAQDDISLQSSQRVGMSHIAFSVRNATEAAERVIALGGSIVNQPAASPDQKVFVFYCHDTEGNLLELVEMR